MLNDAAGSVTCFFQQLRDGKRSAAEQLWEQYCPRLLALARKTLTGQLQRMADAEDAVQSAFASFWRRAERGDFVGELNRNDLWKLLGVITVRKARKQLQRERTLKRGGGKIVYDLPLDEVWGHVGTPDFDLICEELLEELAEELRPFALLRLMGYKNREIADEFGCTERKVERKLQLIRTAWEQHFEDFA